MPESRPSFFGRLTRKFACAARGVVEAIRIENSFKIHFAAAMLVVVLAIALHCSAVEWMFLLVVIGLVFASEMFNTVLELFARLFTKEHNSAIGTLLDISAGVVLVNSIVSLAVGVIIFGPKLWRLVAQ